MRTKESLQPVLDRARELFPETCDIGINDSVEEYPFVYVARTDLNARPDLMSGYRTGLFNYTCFSVGDDIHTIEEDRSLICFIGEKEEADYNFIVCGQREIDAHLNRVDPFSETGD